ncbi:MAG: hypothetical protein ACRCY8_06205 [Dermatophilaceae bacterium]
MTVTHEDTKSWADELDRLIEHSDPNDVEALSQLKGALDPYFDKPETFNTLLSKIQRSVVSSSVEEQLTSRTFSDLSEVEAMLPAGVSVSRL